MFLSHTNLFHLPKESWKLQMFGLCRVPRISRQLLTPESGGLKPEKNAILGTRTVCLKDRLTLIFLKIFK